MGKPKNIKITGHVSGDGGLCDYFTNGKVYKVLYWDRKTGNIPRISSDDGTEHWLVHTIWEPADDDIDAAISILEGFVDEFGVHASADVIRAIKILKNLPRP